MIAARRALRGTRRAMLERGDADLSSGFAPRDFDQLIKDGKVKVSGVPIPNALWYIALNTAKPPFDNVKLRQAIAWAMPYEQIQSSAFFEARRADVWRRCRGGKAGLAAAVPLCHRSRQGEGVDEGSRLRARPRDEPVARHRHRHGRRAHRHPDPGEPRQDRHQGIDRKFPAPTGARR